MKYFFASALILLDTCANSQSVEVGDSVDIYLGKLGSHSSGIAWAYIPEIALYKDHGSKKELQQGIQRRSGATRREVRSDAGGVGSGHSSKHDLHLEEAIGKECR